MAKTLEAQKMTVDNLRKFCILLEDVPERVINLETHIKPKIPDIEVFPGINGRKLTKDYIEKLKYEGYLEDYSLSNFPAGAIGAYLSRMFLYKKCLDDGIEMALVLEDDVNLDDDFEDSLTKVLNEVRDKFDILYLNELMSPDRATRKAFKEQELVSQHCVRVNLWLGFQATVITNKACRSLWEECRPMRTRSDRCPNTLSGRGKLRLVATKQPLTDTFGDRGYMTHLGMLKSQIWNTPYLVLNRATMRMRARTILRYTLLRTRNKLNEYLPSCVYSAVLFGWRKTIGKATRNL
jgi:GR25 family glycosyltransferase involved in LPS biosynthesis